MASLRDCLQTLIDSFDATRGGITMAKAGDSFSRTTAAGLFWLIALTIAFVALVPTSLPSQVLWSVSAVLLVLILRPFAKRLFLRQLLLLLTAAVMFRYLGWRITDTLPGWDDPLSQVFAVILLSCEIYMVCIFLLGALMMSDPVIRQSPDPVHVSELPKVDVLVPSLNEPDEILAITLASIKRFEYPAHLLRVVLCDDGGTDQNCAHEDPAHARAARQRRARLMQMCEALDVEYATRAENVMAKAGNLNAALENLDGDLVAIFDADHAPTPDFLAKTVGYFSEDPKLFLVQTPHHFLNDDPIARNVGVPEGCPPENEMFYGNILNGLDRWDGTFFCGSAALLRREALDEIGGISGNTVTEDAETALELHAQGWRSLYVNHAMIAGLQPESFSSFIKQRGRWAIGMLQILMLQNPLTKRGLKLTQRLTYLNSIGFWLFPLTRLVMLLAPFAYLMFNLQIFATTGQEALSYMLGYVLVSLLAQNALFKSTRWPFQSEMYEVAQTPYLIKAVVSAVFSPRSARFNVTSKDETISETGLSELSRPLVLLTALMAVGVGVAVTRYFFEPGNRETLVLVGSWALFNFVIAGAALGSVVDRQQLRKSPRKPVSAACFIEVPGSSQPAAPAQVVDISVSGMGVRAASLVGLPSKGALISIRLNNTKEPGPIAARIAKKQSGSGAVIGLAFDVTQDASGARAVASLLNGNSQTWEAMRAQSGKPIGLLGGTFVMLRLSVSGLASVLGASLTRQKIRQAEEPSVSAQPEMATTGAFVGFEATSEPTAAAAAHARKMNGTAAKVNKEAIATLGCILIASCITLFGGQTPARAQSIEVPVGALVERSPRPLSRPLDTSKGELSSPEQEGQTIPLPASDPVANDRIELPSNLRADTAEVEQPTLSLPSDLPEQSSATAFAALLAAPHLTETDQTVRLTGEHAESAFVWVLPPNANPKELRISTQSSAFVLPRRSNMTVSVNGVTVGSRALDNLTGQDVDILPLPAHLPLGLRNTVSVEIEQTNRLYCGSDASHQLWTSVALQNSGAELALASYNGASSEFELARIALDVGRGMPVAATANLTNLSGQFSPADPRIKASELAGLLGGPVSFGPAPETALMARNLSIATAIAPMVSEDTDVLMSSPYTVQPMMATKLETMGFDTQHVFTQLWRKDLGFDVPGAWFANSGQTATLMLRYAHTAGLEEGSSLQILVNGQVVRFIPLNTAHHTIEEGLPIRFDAALLAPGGNTLSFVVRRPGMIPDQQCPELSAAFLEIDDQSTLLLPNTAKLALPTVGNVLNALNAQQVVAQPGDQIIQTPDVLTVASAFPALAATSSEKLVLMSPSSLATALPSDIAAVHLALYRALATGTGPRDTPPSQRNTPTPSLFSQAPQETIARAGITEGLFKYIEGAATGIWRLIHPNAARDLEEWLKEELGAQGTLADGAALILTQQKAPYDLALVMGYQAQAIDVANALSQARNITGSLAGQIAIWRPDTGWSVWANPMATPILLEPLRVDNAIEVAGSYASARPQFFALALLALVLMAAAVSSWSLVRSREVKE